MSVTTGPPIPAREYILKCEGKSLYNCSFIWDSDSPFEISSDLECTVKTHLRDPSPESDLKEKVMETVFFDCNGKRFASMLWNYISTADGQTLKLSISRLLIVEPESQQVAQWHDPTYVLTSFLTSVDQAPHGLAFMYFGSTFYQWIRELTQDKTDDAPYHYTLYGLGEGKLSTITFQLSEKNPMSVSIFLGSFQSNFSHSLLRAILVAGFMFQTGFRL